MDCLEEMAEEIRVMAEEGYGELYENYGGRGMYGKTCIGLVTGDPMRTIEEAASRGIRGAVTDDMGIDTIVYWPKIKG